MNVITNQINNALTMEQVIEKYIPTLINKNHTIKCPFHNEKTASFRLYDNSFYCFGCGKGGDIIKFVQLYFNINFQQALVRINYDFTLNLPIGKKITLQEQKEMKLQNMKLEFKRLYEAKQKERKNNRYYDTLSRYIQLENDIRDYAPKSIEELEKNGFNDKYVNALMQIDCVSFLLDIRDAERSEYGK